MLITDKKELEKYSVSNSLWLGIPSVEVTKGNKTYLTFYSGGTKEEIGNYVLLIKSDDGKNFSSPIAVCYTEGHRCYDPCLWIDPLDRLWLTWSRAPENALYGAICENPDADELTWGKEFLIGHDVMMNKPTVLSTGEWLFPVAVWLPNLSSSVNQSSDKIPGSYAYVTCDNGKTFRKLGAADVKERSFDEHMFLEMNGGNIRCFVRTKYGIGAADSYNGGLDWGKDFDTGYGGPCSRFFIKRLDSGRILLVNHYDYQGRNNLTAMLSEDDGKTFPYRLLLDERNNVSYPDAATGKDGMITITYDRERGGFKKCLSDVLECAREILVAKISEEDIIKGTPVNPESYLKHIAVKVEGYNGPVKNPFNEESLFSDCDYAKHLSSTTGSADDIIEKIFDAYEINCSNIHNIEAEKLDELIEKYKKDMSLDTLSEIISLVRSGKSENLYDGKSTVDKICSIIVKNPELSVTTEEIARELHFSTSYIRHIFKKATGISVSGYKRVQQIKKAKLLLKTTDCKVTDIAASCGFENSSYFTEIFTKETGITPTEYRKYK